MQPGFYHGDDLWWSAIAGFLCTVFMSVGAPWAVCQSLVPGLCFQGRRGFECHTPRRAFRRRFNPKLLVSQFRWLFANVYLIWDGLLHRRSQLLFSNGISRSTFLFFCYTFAKLNHLALARRGCEALFFLQKKIMMFCQKMALFWYILLSYQGQTQPNQTGVDSNG